MTLTIAAVLFAGVGVWWLVACALSALRGEWLRAIFLLFAGGTFLAIASTPLVTNQNYRRDDPSSGRVSLHDNSVRILPALQQQIAATSLGLMFIVAGSIFAIGTWTSTLRLPISHGFAVIYPPFVSAVVVVVAGMLGRVWMRGRTYCQLIVSPDVLSHETGQKNTDLRWDDITAVSINHPRMGRSGSTACMIYLHTAGRSAPLEITTNMLSIGCAPTYWLVKYYFEHPEDRDELGDQRAIDRLMSGRVVTKRTNSL